MFLHKSDTFTIYFGDASDKINPQEYLNNPADIFFTQNQSIQQLIVKFPLNHLYFTHQVHGIDGIRVTPQLISNTAAFSTHADFLHTTSPAIGLGIMTADCLPIIFADPINKAIAVIHAGWRGSVQNIAQIALQRMYTIHGTRATDILVFFGPSARACCYKVGPEFVDIIGQTAYHQNVLEERNGKLFLDVSQFNYNQLIAAGVQLQSISQEYNVCTICDVRFCSYRRDAQHSGRQMTIISLV